MQQQEQDQNIAALEKFWRLWLPPSFLGRALKIGADGPRTQVFESMIAAAAMAVGSPPSENNRGEGRRENARRLDWK